MVHLERVPQDNRLSPKFVESAESTIRASVDDPDLTKIARRFAPGATAGAFQDQRLRRQAGRTLARFFSFGIRALFAASIVMSASPRPAFEGFNWLALVEIPRSKPEAAQPGKAFAHSAAVAGGANRQPAAALHPAALTTPGILEGQAGKEIEFKIALVRTAALPARSILAVSGLPSNSMFSSGRPYGEHEWNLRIDEIAGLRLALPLTATGESRLSIRLVAPDGESIASTETALRILSEPHPTVASAPGIALVPVNSGFDASEVPLEMQAEQPWFDEVRELQPAAATPAHVAAALKDEPQAASQAEAPAIEDHSISWIELSDFVNLREGPSSSARIIGRLDKASKARVLGRKHGWLQVAGSGTSATGWVYSRYALTATESPAPRKKLASSRVEPARVGPKPDESFWTRMGRWMTGD